VQGKTPRQTQVEKMTTIIEALEKLAEIYADEYGDETLIQDNANEPAPIHGVIGAISDAAGGLDQIEDDGTEYAVDGDGIWRMKPDGYRESIPTYRVVPIALPDDATVYDTMFEYVDGYGTDIGNYALEPGVNEITPHTDDHDYYYRLPCDIEDPILSRYAEKHGLVLVNWGELETSLMPEDGARTGSAYVIAGENGEWIARLGWFESYDDAEKAYVEDQIPDVLESIKNWDHNDVEELQSLIVAYEDLCEKIDLDPEQRLDYTSLPSEPFPEKPYFDTTGRWALDRHGRYLWGDTVADAGIYRIWGKVDHTDAPHTVTGWEDVDLGEDRNEEKLNAGAAFDTPESGDWSEYGYEYDEGGVRYVVADLETIRGRLGLVV
jgi:hypothetical protein